MSRIMRLAGRVAYMGENRSKNPFAVNKYYITLHYVIYRILVGNSEGKRPRRRLKRRWEDTIKTDL
jgi:hypothetical protein